MTSLCLRFVEHEKRFQRNRYVICVVKPSLLASRLHLRDVTVTVAVAVTDNGSSTPSAYGIVNDNFDLSIQNAFVIV